MKTIPRETPRPSPKPQGPEEVKKQVERILKPLHAQANTAMVATTAQLMMRQMSVFHPDDQQAVWHHVLATLAQSSGEQVRRIIEENKRLKQPPHEVALLEEVVDSKDGVPLAQVNSHNGLQEVPISNEVDKESLIPGHRVILAQNGAVLEVRQPAPANPTCELDRVLPDGRLLVQMGGHQTSVLTVGDVLLEAGARESLKTGDLLEYEPSSLLALRVAHSAVRTREFAGEIPDVTRDDVGGLHEVFEEIEQKVLGPHTRPDLYRRYRVGVPRGILLTGPPGVGKTMVAKATASSILAQMGLNEGAPILFTISGSMLLRSYVGEGPTLVRAIAKTAEEAAKLHGYALVILDDFEYGGGLTRGVGDASSPAYSSLTSSLISTLDGMGERDVPVTWMATANRPDVIDSALLRPGRFGTTIKVPRPDAESCAQILNVHLAGVPLADDTDLAALAEAVVEEVFGVDERNLLLRIQYADAEIEEVFPSRVVSGAILAEAVREASLRAIVRDRSNGNGQVGGLRCEDLTACLRQSFRKSVSAITPLNAHHYYLDLPDDRRIVSVDQCWAADQLQEHAFVV